MLAVLKPRYPVGTIRFQYASPHRDTLTIVNVDQPADCFEESIVHSALIEACAPAKLG